MAVAASLSFAAVATAGFELVSTRFALALSLDLASRSTRNWGASPFSLWQLVLQLSLCYLPHRQQAASQPGRQAAPLAFSGNSCKVCPCCLPFVGSSESEAESLYLSLSLLLSCALSIHLSLSPLLCLSLSLACPSDQQQLPKAVAKNSGRALHSHWQLVTFVWQPQREPEREIDGEGRKRHRHGQRGSGRDR